jgi:hypothetical protein
MAPAEAATNSGYFGFRLEDEERDRGDIEVPLQTLTVQVPEEPLQVNGSPYTFAVDEEALGRATNFVRTATNRGWYEPKALVIRFGESLPEKITGHANSKSSVYDYKDRKLAIQIPGEITKKSMPNPILVPLMEDVLNDDLGIGLDQSLRMKRAEKREKHTSIAAMAVSMSIGEGLGVATTASSHQPEAILGGAIAGLGGGFITWLVGAVAQDKFQKHKLQVDRYDLNGIIAHRAEKKRDAHGIDSELQKFLTKPIISLEPARTDSE